MTRITCTDYSPELHQSQIVTDLREFLEQHRPACQRAPLEELVEHRLCPVRVTLSPDVVEGDDRRALDSGLEHVDLIVSQHAQVHRADARAGRAEQNIGDVRRPHRAAPPIGQGSTNRCVQDVAGVLVIAHVGAV